MFQGDPLGSAACNNNLYLSGLWIIFLKETLLIHNVLLKYFLKIQSISQVLFHVLVFFFIIPIKFQWVLSNMLLLPNPAIPLYFCCFWLSLSSLHTQSFLFIHLVSPSVVTFHSARPDFSWRHNGFWLTQPDFGSSIWQIWKSWYRSVSHHTFGTFGTLLGFFRELE